MYKYFSTQHSLLDVAREKLIMNIILFCCLIVGVQIVASENSSVCMADCTSLLTPRPPSLYEQYCCIPSNSGKKFKLKESNKVNFIHIMSIYILYQTYV